MPDIERHPGEMMMLTKIFLQGVGATAVIGAAALAWSSLVTPANAQTPSVPAPVAAPAASQDSGYLAPGSTASAQGERFGKNRDEHERREGRDHHRDRDHDDDDDDGRGRSWSAVPFQPSAQPTRSETVR